MFQNGGGFLFSGDVRISKKLYVGPSIGINVTSNEITMGGNGNVKVTQTGFYIGANTIKLATDGFRFNDVTLNTVGKLNNAKIEDCYIGNTRIVQFIEQKIQSYLTNYVRNVTATTTTIDGTPVVTRINVQR